MEDMTLDGIINFSIYVTKEKSNYMGILVDADQAGYA